MMRFMWRNRHFLGLAALAFLAAPGCNDYTPDEEGAGPAQRLLLAKVVESEDELIGGPSARGGLGDFLIQNDKVRFIIGGKRQTFMGGVFGGTLLDADRVRSRSDQRYGMGFDAFSETFPLVNLLIANPYQPGSNLAVSKDGVQLVGVPSGIEVIKDGSDGEAIVRVTGRAGYIFEMLKFLNKDFLGGFLSQPLAVAGFNLPIDKLLKNFLKVNVYALLNRLQLDFLFQTDYILHKGDEYLTLRTTVTTAPPSEKSMVHCPKMECELQCANGYALQEVSYSLDAEKDTCDAAKELCGLTMCPMCACAEDGQDMATLNESEDIFKIMLGDIGPWRDPSWKGGILGGDFLFMGSDVDLFTPGLGFNEQPKVFNNLWQGVPTLASPLVFPWIAATGENVSYGWVTRNPEQKEGFDCPTWRVALTYVDYPREAAVVKIFVERLGYSQAEAEAKVRQAIVDRRPIFLKDGIPVEQGTDLDAWKDYVLEHAVLDGVAPDPEDPEKTVPAEVALQGLFPEAVKVDLVPATECKQAQLLIPLFSTSATAVMTHKSPSSMDVVDGVAVDTRRTFTFERYFVVGEGDVASVLKTVYGLQGEQTGKVEGTVVYEGSMTPVTHASVVVVKDPRTDAKTPAFATYDELLAACKVTFGDGGYISQMQSDMGLDEELDGNFGGELLPGSYFLVPFAAASGPGKPVPITVKSNTTAHALVAIPQEGSVYYRIQDEGGKPVPSRITFIRLDENGDATRWEGRTYPELGGKGVDHGIQKLVQTTKGEGTVHLAAGSYEVYVSRGFEFSVWHTKPFVVQAGRQANLSAVVVRELDTNGWISADLHMHSIMSIDSGIELQDRVAAIVSEGVEYVAATDHDYVTFFEPFLNALGIHKYLKANAGIETTTLEFGHFNAYPLKYRDTDQPVHGAPEWYGKYVGQVWDMLRDLAAPGFDRSEVVIQVNHPEDGQMGYFGQMGLTSYNMQRDTSGMEMCNPMTEHVSCDFDAMEIFNEKRFELLRTPTIAEMHWYNQCTTEIYQAGDASLFKVNTAKPEESVCGTLQLPPHAECTTIEEVARVSKATDLERAKLMTIRDECRWAEDFRRDMETASKMDILSAKRLALDAIKMLAVKRMIDRLPDEQAAYFATTPETDLGCDYEKAMEGCTAILDEENKPMAGCTDAECVIGQCVCAAHPECCLDPEEAGENGVVGTGWDDACAVAAANECFGCGVRPCTSKIQSWDDWFALLNWGMNITAVGNSDTHSTSKEVGQPRNFVKSSTDDPFAIDVHELMRNIKAHKVIVSTGPFARFHIGTADVGETLSKPQGTSLPVRIRVETSSWTGVDHIELHRNGKMEKIIRIDPKKEETVDFDQIVEMPMPTEDSWYVLIAYGLGSEYHMSPIYKRAPWGQMLVSTIIAMGGKSILLSFSGLLEEVTPLLSGLGMSLEGLLTSALGSEELPDVFTMMPVLVTNPIWVDVDGDGFEPVNAVDADQDGKWDLPPFCSRPCPTQAILDEQGNFTGWGQSECGLNQTCVPDSENSPTGTCLVPISANCVGKQTAQ